MDLTDLFCSEEIAQVCVERNDHIDYNLEVASQTDANLLQDGRVVKNMLREERLISKIDYCSNLQTEIKPHMRKIVVDWMLEVCEDQQCQPQVYHLAVNYLDRCLSRTNIPKQCFQSVAAGCLFLSSKFSEVRPLSSEVLSLYTDHSVSVLELREWELKILNILEWELSNVTVQSFLQHFSSNLDSKVGRHAEILSAAATTEYKYLLLRPSLVAAASLSAVCRAASLHYNIPTALLRDEEQIRFIEDHLLSLLLTLSNLGSNPNLAQPSSQKLAGSKPREGTLTPTDCHQVSAFVGAYSRSSSSSTSSSSSSSSSLSSPETSLPPFHTVSSRSFYYNTACV